MCALSSLETARRLRPRPRMCILSTSLSRRCRRGLPKCYLPRSGAMFSTTTRTRLMTSSRSYHTSTLTCCRGKIGEDRCACACAPATDRCLIQVTCRRWAWADLDVIFGDLLKYLTLAMRAPACCVGPERCIGRSASAEVPCAVGSQGEIIWRSGVQNAFSSSRRSPQCKCTRGEQDAKHLPVCAVVARQKREPFPRAAGQRRVPILSQPAGKQGLGSVHRILHGSRYPPLRAIAPVAAGAGHASVHALRRVLGRTCLHHCTASPATLSLHPLLGSRPVRRCATSVDAHGRCAESAGGGGGACDNVQAQDSLRRGEDLRGHWLRTLPVRRRTRTPARWSAARQWPRGDASSPQSVQERLERSTARRAAMGARLQWRVGRGLHRHRWPWNAQPSRRHFREGPLRPELFYCSPRRNEAAAAPCQGTIR